MLSLFISFGNIQGPGSGLFFVDPSTGNISVTFNSAISTIIAFLTVVASLFFLFQLFIAAMVWLNAGGNEKNAAAARQRIMNAIMGLVVVVAAYGIAALVGNLIGLPIFNPLSVFNPSGAQSQPPGTGPF